MLLKLLVYINRKLMGLFAWIWLLAGFPLGLIAAIAAGPSVSGGASNPLFVAFSCGVSWACLVAVVQVFVLPPLRILFTIDERLDNVAKKCDRYKVDENGEMLGDVGSPAANTKGILIGAGVFSGLLLISIIVTFVGGGSSSSSFVDAKNEGLFDSEFPRRETLYLLGEQFAPPGSFNPIAETWATSWPIGNDNNLVFETLLSFNKETRELEPLLASLNVKLSNNDSIVVDLNPAARWSDGKIVSSDDVLFSYLKSPNRSLGGVIKDIHVKKNRGMDDQISFIINKKENGNPLVVKTLLQNIKIVPSHVFAPLLEKYGVDEVKKLPMNDGINVSSGPYEIKSADDKKIVLIRREDYWGNQSLHAGKSAVPKYIVHPIVSTLDEAWQMFQKGKIDVSQIFIPQVGELKNSSMGTWLEQKPYYVPANVVALIVNTTKAPLDDKVFRRAMAAAIDYSKLSDVSVSGYSPKMFPGLIIPYGYEKKLVNAKDVETYGVKFGESDNLRKKIVQEMLSSIGVTSKWSGDSLLYMKKNGRRLPTLYITTPAGWSDWESMVAVAVEGMRSAGIDVKAKIVDGGEYWPAMGLGNFDLVMHKPATDVTPSQLWGRFDEVMSSRNWVPLGSWAGTNIGRYNDPKSSGYRPEVDELLSAIPFMVDHVEIENAFGELNKVFMEDQPAIPLAYMPEQYYEFYSGVWTNWPTAKSPYAPARVPGHGSSTNILWNLKLK